LVKDKKTNCLTSNGVFLFKPGMPDSIESMIRAKLTHALSPVVLEIVDESAKHAGHAGARPGEQTHFRLTVVSSAFEDLSRVARQRKIYGLLEEEFSAGLHALSLRALTPEEANRNR
jgi:BolA protein